MRISSATALYEALRDADRQVLALLADLAGQINGVLLRYSGADGTIPLDRLDDVLRDAGALVEQVFVVRQAVPTQERLAELAHLDSLIERAQADLETASQQQRPRLIGRLRQLGQRRALLGQGIVLRSVTNDLRGLSPMGRLVAGQLETVTEAVVDSHAKVLRGLLRDAPDVSQVLEGAL